METVTDSLPLTARVGCFIFLSMMTNERVYSCQGTETVEEVPLLSQNCIQGVKVRRGLPVTIAALIGVPSVKLVNTSNTCAPKSRVGSTTRHRTCRVALSRRAW